MECAPNQVQLDAYSRFDKAARVLYVLVAEEVRFGRVDVGCR
jgi:hypothetical protein